MFWTKRCFWYIIRENENFDTRLGPKTGIFCPETLHYIIVLWWIWCVLIFSICSVWSLSQRHSWNSLPCSHQHTFSIATFYRPPATTISYDSNSSSPEKEITSSNRLGTPPPPPLDGGLRSQKGLRPFNPLQRIGVFSWKTLVSRCKNGHFDHVLAPKRGFLPFIISRL